MVKKLLKWLKVEDAFEKGLIARILVILCLVFILFGALFVAFRIFVTVHPALLDAHWTDILIESIIFLGGLASLLLIRADKMRQASRALMGCLLIILSMQAYFIGDPANDIAGAVGLLLFAFLAILLLEGWDRWIAVALVIGVFVGLYLLASAGKLMPAITLDPLGKALFTFFVWISVGIIIAIITIAAMGAMRREPQLLQKQAEQSISADNPKSLLYLSTHDALTGLYNRLFFETEFTRLGRSRQYPISILMADIDGLEKINERYGNGEGDRLLINVARVIAKALRQEDIITRYGEDEFAILLPNTDESTIEIILQRIQKQVEKFNQTHTKVPINLSMGASTAKQGEPLKNHLKQASTLLKKEKASK